MTRDAALLTLACLLSCSGDGSGVSTPGADSDASSSSGGSPGGGSSDGASGDSSTGGLVDGGGRSAAAKLALKLRGKAQFLIGMGNDLADNHNNDGAYTLGTTLDLHYAYLVGLQGHQGWPDWNSGGTFVNILADSASAHGTTPMYTLYGMAAQGENNVSVLTNDAFMGPYWNGAKLLFQRIAAFGKVAAVHLEPDFWGFVQSVSPDATRAVHVTTLAPDCASLTNDVAGMARCLLKLGRMYAPQAVIGFHASQWGADASSRVAFWKILGATEADFVAMETLDRDAGCFEAHVDPNCQRGGTTGWYWDETNATSPNFHEHLAWAKAVADGVGLPIMWWQIPFGVPSSTPGGAAGHYRDNRVKYIFAHTEEFVAAGGVGAVFGTGAGNQTYITSDGDQFKTAVNAYYAHPTPLP